MIRRRKKCRFCRELFHPHPQTYRQQITCEKAACRSWRRRQAQAEWRVKNPLYDQSRRGKVRRWQEERGAAYMRGYRANHPAYVAENRRRQRDRDLGRGVLVKQNEWRRLCLEKRRRNRLLRGLVKRDEWPSVLWQELDGIWGSLSRARILVKPTDMA